MGMCCLKCNGSFECKSMPSKLASCVCVVSIRLDPCMVIECKTLGLSFVATGLGGFKCCGPSVSLFIECE